MVKYITDLNIESMDFNRVESGMLIFNHRQFTRFEYKAPASIKYVQKGRISYLIDGKEISVRSGNYLFVNEGVEVLTTVSEASEGYSIFLNKDMSLGHHLNTFPILDTGLIKYIESTKSRMIGESLDSITYIHQHLTNYLTQAHDHLDMLSLKTAGARLDILKKLLLVKSTIERNPKSMLSLAQLAENACLSKYELIRRFKEVFGITPYKFYQLNKIEATKRELLSGKTLMQIAVIYHLGDAHTFSKLFKKTTGFTPSEYRELHRN
ncbi:MAG: helix-turn-helix transcriptional regulator [Cytophagales bacterium]|nr:helix-turn-helix transcriptional regulator [Cytophagales bacterium]